MVYKVMSVLIALVVLVWIGLKIQPAPFPAISPPQTRPKTIPLPLGLPQPVETFFRVLYGEEIPVIDSAVITGRATLRLGGITFPGRFRFTHDAGQGYRHYIEATLFGLPIMKVNELYLDGVGRMELPFGVIEGEPKVNQAANQGLWSESMWLPAIFLTDPRVRWEPMDEHTARLIVPLGDDQQEFTVFFNPETGLITHMETMRYKDVNSDLIRWVTEAREWGVLSGETMLQVGAVIWEDEGTPWAVFTVEEVIYNTDVSQYIRSRGL